jgi:hypothetical protein
MEKNIYIIIGETEEVAQSKIGGDFESFYIKEVVGYVDSSEEAEAYIKLNRLKAPRKESYSGTKYYKGGYYDMTYELATKL